MRTANLITKKQVTVVVEIKKMNEFNPRKVKIDRMSEDQRQKPKETTNIWKYKKKNTAQGRPGNT